MEENTTAHDAPLLTDREAKARVLDGQLDRDVLAWATASVASAADDGYARVVLARCLAARGKYGEALSHIEQVVATDPSNGVARNQREELKGQAILEQRAVDLLAEGEERLLAELGSAKNDERERYFQVAGRRILFERNGDLAAWSAFGGALRRAALLTPALETYDEALDTDHLVETNAPAHTGRAAVLREMGRLDEAEEGYRRVLAHRPQDPYARSGLAAVELDRFEQRGDRAALGRAQTLVGGIPPNAAQKVRVRLARCLRSASGTG